MNTTGERLRQLRLSKGWSQAEVAEKIGVHRVAYLQYESGASRPVRKLKELSALFGVSTDYILGNTAQESENVSDTEISDKKTLNLVESLFPDNPEIVKCLHNISEDGFISDGDSKYKLDESARNMLRAMIIAALKEAKEKGIDHAKIHLP